MQMMTEIKLAIFMKCHAERSEASLHGMVTEMMLATFVTCHAERSEASHPADDA